MGRPRKTPEELQATKDAIRERRMTKTIGFSERQTRLQAEALTAFSEANPQNQDVLAQMDELIRSTKPDDTDTAPSAKAQGPILAPNGQPASATQAPAPAVQRSSLHELVDDAFDHFKGKGLDSTQAATLTLAYSVMEFAAVFADLKAAILAQKP